MTGNIESFPRDFINFVERYKWPIIATPISFCVPMMFYPPFRHFILVDAGSFFGAIISVLGLGFFTYKQFQMNRDLQRKFYIRKNIWLFKIVDSEVTLHEKFMPSFEEYRTDTKSINSYDSKRLMSIVLKYSAPISTFHECIHIDDLAKIESAIEDLGYIGGREAQLISLFLNQFVLLYRRSIEFAEIIDSPGHEAIDPLAGLERRCKILFVRARYFHVIWNDLLGVQPQYSEIVGKLDATLRVD